MPKATKSTVQPDPSLAARLSEARLGVSPCFQCRKCSSGCPLTFAMDLLPDKVIRLALLGQEDQVLGSRTIWVCSACETCTTRCPNGIDIAGVMDWLKEEAVKRGVATPQPGVAAFHRVFLESIRQAGGRLPEALMLRRYGLFKLWHRPNFPELVRDLKLGLKLWKKGRLRLAAPPALKGRGEIEAIFRQAGF
jgi:heterodisulfide reductase subunit C